jgi:hypothetical protein
MDGTLAEAGAGMGVTSRTTDLMYIGRSSLASGPWLTGNVRHVMLFSRPLSALEVILLTEELNRWWFLA